MIAPQAPYAYRSDPRVPTFADDKPVIVFDGLCALCSGWATFVMRHDKSKAFRLIKAQSELGQSLYIHYGLNPQEFETNILIENGVAWFKSDGTIRMAAGLGWPWRAAVILRILPTRFRDYAYDMIARNRFRLYGRRHSCYVPAPGDADRFLG